MTHTASPTALPAPQHGFTLVELMIAMTLGLILMAGVMAMFGVTMRGNTELVSSARLNGDLGAVVSIASSEFRRAGYAQGQQATLFTNALSDINVPNSSCVLYSYDANSNGTIENSERLGFRLKSDTTDPSKKWLEMRSSCAVSGTCDSTTPGYPHCNCATNCDLTGTVAEVGTWEKVTDPNFMRIMDIDMNADGVIEFSEKGFAISTTGSKCINTANNHYWVTTAPLATSFPCPAANVTTPYNNPAGTQGYIPSGTAYTTGTAQATAGARLVEIRHLNLSITGCVVNPADKADSGTLCNVDSGEEFALFRGAQHQPQIKVRNDRVIQLL